MLGFSWSRTTLTMPARLHGMAPCEIVQLTGALSRPDVDESSVELVRDVARVTGGAASYFYAPMIVPVAEVAASLRMQPEVAQAMARFDKLTKAVVTIGAWRLGQSTVADAVTPEEYKVSLDAGVVCELGGLQLASTARQSRRRCARRRSGSSTSACAACRRSSRSPTAPRRSSRYAPPSTRASPRRW